MERNTIRDYLGKTVRVEVSAGKDEHPTYWGKVSDYDGDFVTLNPYIHEIPTAWESAIINDIDDFDKKFKTGKTNIQITINRRIIDSIETLVSFTLRLPHK